MKKQILILLFLLIFLGCQQMVNKGDSLDSSVERDETTSDLTIIGRSEMYVSSSTSLHAYSETIAPDDPINWQIKSAESTVYDATIDSSTGLVTSGESTGTLVIFAECAQDSKASDTHTIVIRDMPEASIEDAKEAYIIGIEGPRLAMSAIDPAAWNDPVIEITHPSAEPMRSALVARRDFVDGLNELTVVQDSNGFDLQFSGTLYKVGYLEIAMQAEGLSVAEYLDPALLKTKESDYTLSGTVKSLQANGDLCTFTYQTLIRSKDPSEAYAFSQGELAFEHPSGLKDRVTLTQLQEIEKSVNALPLRLGTSAESEEAYTTIQQILFDTFGFLNNWDAPIVQYGPVYGGGEDPDSYILVENFADSFKVTINGLLNYPDNTYRIVTDNLIFSGLTFGDYMRNGNRIESGSVINGDLTLMPGIWGGASDPSARRTFTMEDLTSVNGLFTDGKVLFEKVVPQKLDILADALNNYTP